MRVIELTFKDGVTNQEIAHAIKSDPALSSRVIKLANALVAYQTRPILSIIDAVTVLGLNSVQQLVLGLSLMDNSRNVACHKFDYQNFWAGSLLTAITAQNLVLQSEIGSPEEIFILGLLGKIGALSLATAYPLEYARVLEAAAANPDSRLDELERAEFGFCHNELTQAMLASWGMPQVFQEIARHHEDPSRSGFAGESRDWCLLNVMHVADYFSRVCLAKELSRRKMAPKLILSAARMGVESEELVKVGDKSVREWRDWSKICGIRALAVPPLSELLEAVPLTADMLENGEDLSVDTDMHNKLHILLVDDDRAVLFMLKTLLENAGHTVATAADGEEALGLLEKSMPQLIITDWAMPKMNGLEFCKAIRRNPLWRNIYIFIMAAQESTELLVGAFEAGANDYITKPINAKIFGARLRAGQRVIHLQEELEFDRQQLYKFAGELAASNQRFQQLALTDVLTGLPNRRSANEHLERHWALAERGDRQLSCMMIDVDRFKQINDTYGHKTGDDALKQVAYALRGNTRAEDVVCRFGGEEFLLICPDISVEQAFQKAEMLRQYVAALNVLGNDGQVFNLTVSIGVASKSPDLPNVESLLQLADKRLYIAKNGGRNCTVAG